MKSAIFTVLTIIYLIFTVAPSAFAQSAGEKVFHDKMCAKCHTVTAYGLNGDKKLMKSPDLSDTGNKRDGEFLMKYLRKKIKLNGKKHIKRFKGSKEEFLQLQEWLLSLKKPVGE